MKIKFEKGKVAGFYNLIMIVKVKGRKARALAKFGKLLDPKVKELLEDERALIAEYYEVGDDGNSKKDKDGKPILLEGADGEAYQKEWESLHEEDMVVDLTEYEPYMEHLLAGLNDWDEPINGMDALVYDELLDILESAE